MKTIIPLIFIVLFAGGCSPKSKDEAVIAFMGTLRKFPEAGIMPWENGMTGVLNTKSNKPEKVISEIVSNFKGYEVIGPITRIPRKEWDLYDVIYGVQAIRTDTMHTVPEPPVQTIIFIFRRDAEGKRWNWREYDRPTIQRIEESVSEGIAKRKLKNSNRNEN